MNNLAQAIEFATKMHKGQTRKYVDQPYIQHPLRVMAAVACDKTIGGREVPAMAAVLHDVVEDCDVEYLDAGEWGYLVANYVRELTHIFTPESFPELNRAARKAREAQRLAGISFVGKIIKMYDRIDNLESFFEVPMTEEMAGFGRVFAKESWDLMTTAFGDNELAYLSARVGALAMKLRDACETFGEQ